MRAAGLATSARRCLACIALTLAALAPATARAELNMVAQAGANQGLFAFGVTADHDAWLWAATYGVTPSSEDDVLITQVNLKSGFAVYRGDDFRLLLGPVVLLNASDRTFFSLPGQYPDGYYPPNAYFFALNAGITTRSGWFVELSMLDYYFDVLLRNPRGSVANTGLASLGFGRTF